MNRQAIRKWALYAGFGLLMMLLQEYLLARFRIAGVHPLLGGVLTGVVAMLEGGIGGGAFGLYVGVLQDAASVGPEGYYAFLYLVCGTAAGLISEYLFRKNFFSAMLWSFAVTAVSTLIFFVLFYLITGRAEPSAIWRTALPEILYSTMMFPLVYFPARRIADLPNR